MKKKVRIYKAPDGKGKYINKTSKFLAKAQMGGTPDPSMLAYPGSQPAQQQNQTDQLIQFVIGDITNQVSKEETLFKLVNIMGIPVDAATELYVTIAEKLTEDIEKEDDRTYEEETGQPRRKANPLTKDAVITENPEEETDYDLFDDTGADIVMEDSQEQDILDESLDPLAEQKYGGAMRRYQNGGEYDVALPDIDSYESLVEPMTGYDLISEMAWNSNKDSESPYLDKEYANTTLDYSKLQKGGAYKKSKKKYVNSVMQLLKKQMGGTNESDVDPNQGDPTGSNFRDGRLKSFTNSVRKTAEMSAMQNQIEQQYDQMMQEGGITMPEQDIENPMHHLQLYSQATSGIFGEPMNETVKARKGLFVKDDDLPVQNEDLLNIPRGFYRRSMRRFGNIPNLREVDVRKSGLFGPKQYTMYFDPLPLQQLGNPLAAETYGYGSGTTASRKHTRTFDAVKTYTNLAADAVNQESLKEVDKNTPENESTTVKEGNTETAVATESNIQRTPNSSSSGSGTRATPVVTKSVDAWGRQPEDRWYGFDPDKKAFTVASSFQPSNASTQLFSAANPEGEYYRENNRYYKKVGDNYFEIVDPARIKQLKESQVLNYQKIPGVNTTYSRDAFGNWIYYDEKAGKFRPSTDEERLKALQAGKNKSAEFGTLPSKPGYYYRIANDGSYIKYKGDPAKHTKTSKPIATIKKGDKTYDYLRKNVKVEEALLPILRQYGGVIQDPFNDPLEPLQKFVGGGYDPSIADLTENQIQYMDSKDITDPYMQDGGLIKNFIPANLVRSSRNDVVQRVYNPVTGQTYSQIPPGAARQISAIDVRKRGITGRPKKYTIYYGGAGSMPPKTTTEDKKDDTKKDTKTKELSAKEQALANAGYGERTDVTGLKAKSKAAIRRGERKRDRELEKLYEEDPTSVAFDPINLDAPFDRTASNNRAYNVNDLVETTTAEDFATWGVPQDMMDQPVSQDQMGNNVRVMTSDFAPMAMEGPLATEEDQVPTFEEEYMDGFQPTITQEMIDQAAGLTIPQEPINMGAWSGMDYPADIIQPGVNPFDLPIGGGEEYYPPFAQPVAKPVTQVVKPKQNKTQTLDEWRAGERKRSNYGKTYTYTPNMTGMEKDPDYIRAMQTARKDGVVTNQEANNATRVYKQKQAEKEKAKIAAQAQRTIDQIMSTSASAAEKNKAREKVILQMQQRWDIIDRAVNSKKYGGALSRFVGGGSQSFTGENPVGYANNPAVGNTEAYNFNTLSNPTTEEDFATWGVPGMPKEKMEKMPTLPASAGLVGFAKGTEQLAGTNTPLAIDVKNKLSQGEREARLIAGNTLMRGVAGFKNRIDDSKQMADFYDNFSADNLYASDPSRDRGDYAESGLYRPDEQGQTWYGRSAQMGGYIDDDFEDGEEVYMTDEEIKEYMANGGQIEFI